eukprot:1333311-Amorphochlora_amoeboformis.AAC.1
MARHGRKACCWAMVSTKKEELQESTILNGFVRIVKSICASCSHCVLATQSLESRPCGRHDQDLSSRSG